MLIRESLTHCIECKEEFSKFNTFSPLGWKETQISGLCEKCFDEILPQKDYIPEMSFYPDYD
jgi:hypothetical protein